MITWYIFTCQKVNVNDNSGFTVIISQEGLRPPYMESSAEAHAVSYSTLGCLCLIWYLTILFNCFYFQWTVRIINQLSWMRLVHCSFLQSPLLLFVLDLCYWRNLPTWLQECLGFSFRCDDPIVTLDSLPNGLPISHLGLWNIEFNLSSTDFKVMFWTPMGRLDFKNIITFSG